MARFRGTLQGSRGEASRLGDTNSGLRVEACSWSGKIVVVLDSDDTDVGRKAEKRTDVVRISASDHGNSRNPTGTLFEGTFDDLAHLITWWKHRDQINAVIALLGTNRLGRLTEEAR